MIRNLVIDRTLAAHTSPRTTRLYDRTNDQITLNEVKKLAIIDVQFPRVSVY